jgi:hypothetical protein
MNIRLTREFENLMESLSWFIYFLIETPHTFDDVFVMELETFSFDKQRKVVN